MKLVFDVDNFRSLLRDHAIQRDERNQPDGDKRKERRAPSEGLAQRRPRRHAQHVRNRQPAEHQRHGLRALVIGHKIGRNDTANAEKRPVAQRGQHARA